MADLPKNTEGEYAPSASAARILEAAKAAPQWDFANDRLLVPTTRAALATVTPPADTGEGA